MVKMQVYNVYNYVILEYFIKSAASSEGHSSDI